MLWGALLKLSVSLLISTYTTALAFSLTPNSTINSLESETILCFSNTEGGPHISWQSCRPVFNTLDQDILLHPEPQTWGIGGIQEKEWGNPNTECYILVTNFDQEWSVTLHFSYALMKRLALSTLARCSAQAGKAGRGGRFYFTGEVVIVTSGK